MFEQGRWLLVGFLIEVVEVIEIMYHLFYRIFVVFTEVDDARASFLE